MYPLFCVIVVLNFAFRTQADYLLGSYTAPVDLSSDKSIVSAAWQNLSLAFDDYLLHHNGSELLSGIENVTFSTGMFSIHDPAAIKLRRST